MKTLKITLSALLTIASDLFYGAVSNWKKNRNKYY